MGGQVIWPLASEAQQVALANVPKLTSSLSILGSCYIIVDILRLKKRNTYHRIILGMNIMDLMSLVAWFFTTWPIPVGTPGVMGARGNQGTCDAQGFFSQLSIATVLYNVCLAIYFMLVIRHGWTEKRIAETKLEYYFHTVCIGVGIGTAVAALAMDLYNPAGWQCWIAVAPTGCSESWEWDSSGPSTKHHNNETTTRFLQEALENLFLNATANATTNATNVTNTTNTTIEEDPFYIPCERGLGANIYVWFLFYFPLWTSILVASCCLYQVYAAYHQQDLIVEKWRQKLLMTANQSTGRVIGVATDATKKISGVATAAATTTTHKLTHVAKRPFVAPARQASKRKRPLSTTPVYTPAQRKKLLKKQRSKSPTNLPSAPQCDSKYHKNCEQQPTKSGLDGSETTANHYYSARMGDLSRESSLASISGSSSRRPKDKPLPPVLGSRVYTGRTHHPKIDQLNTTLNNDTTNGPHLPKLPMPILRRGKTDDTHTTTAPRQQRRRHQNAKSKLVTSQALLYLCSFYVAWAFPSIMRIQESTTAEGVAYYHWMFLSAFFCPLQGLMNFIVYIRPKFIAIRREKKRIAAIARQKREMEKLKGQNSYYRSYYKNAKEGGDKSTVGTAGAGSSSALFTIQSEDAVADSQQLSQSGLGSNNSSHHTRQSMMMDEQPTNTIVEVEGLPSSSDESDGEVEPSLHLGNQNAVWTQADLAALEAGEGSMHSEAVTDLFDALTTNDKSYESSDNDRSLQFTIPPVTPTKKRPKFFRSNSSNSNFNSMRPADGRILTDDEILTKFHTSVSYDSRGHVNVTREGRSPTHAEALNNSESSFNASWTKKFGKSISNFIKRAGSSVSSHKGSIADDNELAEEFNEPGSSLSFNTGLESQGAGTINSSGVDTMRSSGSASFGLETIPSSGSLSFQTAQSSAALSIQSSNTSPSAAASSLHSSGTGVRFATGSSHLMATSIAEEETEDDDASTNTPPPFASRPRTSNPHPIDSGVRTQFKNFRRSRQQQEADQMHPSFSDHDDRMGTHRISMDMLPSNQENSRRVHRPLRRTATDPNAKTKAGGLRRSNTGPGTSPRRRPNDVSPPRRRPNDAPPPPMRVKGVSWRRSPVVDVNLDHGADFASSAGDAGSSDGMGAMFSVGSSVTSSKGISRRDLFKKTRSGWKSTKNQGAKLVKGGKSGIKSIRNFASTFKDALTADAYDDWATALDESDILGNGDAEETTGSAKKTERLSSHPLQEVSEDWRESSVKCAASHEEEKEEINAFDHHDAFEQEHADTVHKVHDPDEYQKKGSNRSLL